MKADFLFRFCGNLLDRKVLLMSCAAIFLLASCTDPKTRELVAQRAGEAERGLAMAAQPGPGKRYNPLVVSDKVWTGGSAIRMHRGVPLPAKYETTRGIILISSEPMTLADIGAAISSQTGIPVRVVDAGGAARAGGAPAAGGATPAGATMQVAYEGSLSGLMEKVSGHFGVGWRFDGISLAVSRFQTRIFVMEALPGAQTVTDDINGSSTNSGGGGGSGGGEGGGGGGGASSGLTQSTGFTFDLRYWDELGQILTAMLGGTGSVVVSPSIGTVTVTTTPELMRSVADYIGQENSRLSRQVAVTVEIYNVSLSEGMDFNVAFQTAIARVGNLTAGFNGTSLTPAFADGATTKSFGTLSLAILNPDGADRVNDVFNALSTVGDTTKVAKFPLITLNNRPVSRFVGEQINYVSSAENSNSVTGTTTTPTTELETDTLNIGFTVQLTPRILDDGRILLQYSLSNTDLKKIDSFNSQCGLNCTGAAGSTTTQLPNTLSNNFIQQSILKSGSMLLIGGAEVETTKQNSQGVGNPFNFLLGGGTSSFRTRTMLFIAIRPQVLDAARSEQD